MQTLAEHVIERARSAFTTGLILAPFRSLPLEGRGALVVLLEGGWGFKPSSLPAQSPPQERRRGLKGLWASA